MSGSSLTRTCQNTSPVTTTTQKTRRSFFFYSQDQTPSPSEKSWLAEVSHQIQTTEVRTDHRHRQFRTSEPKSDSWSSTPPGTGPRKSIGRSRRERISSRFLYRTE